MTTIYKFKTEHEFHGTRRMFIIFHGGDVLVATKGDVRSHFEWLASLFGSDEARAFVKNCTRGYVLGNRMVVYKGEDFSHWVTHTDVMHALDLFDRMTEGGIKEVGLGATYEKDAHPWPPKILLGANDYTSKILQRVENRTKLAEEIHAKTKSET